MNEADNIVGTSLLGFFFMIMGPIYLKVCVSHLTALFHLTSESNVSGFVWEGHKVYHHLLSNNLFIENGGEKLINLCEIIVYKM